MSQELLENGREIEPTSLSLLNLQSNCDRIVICACYDPQFKF